MHLTEAEFEQLIALRAQKSNVEGMAPERLQHLRDCGECRDTLDRYQEIEAKLAILSAADSYPQLSKSCPADTAWADIAAGTMHETDAKLLLEHASMCAACGSRLALIMNVLDNPSGETSEAAADPEWRKVMSAQMRRASNPPVIQMRRWSTIGIAAGLILAVVGAYLYRMKSRPPDDLLAAAYAERRTIELRFGGASWGPVHIERGSGQMQAPTELLESEARIRKELRNHPDDPVWLQASGRAAILRSDYERAIADLERTESLKPSCGARTDLATAYVLRGDKLQQPSDYGIAAEHLGRALKECPDDEIARFNRAIVYTRLLLFTAALDDWRRYLTRDRSGPWAAEAKKRMQSVETILNQRSRKAASEPQESRVSEDARVDLFISDYACAALLQRARHSRSRVRAPTLGEGPVDRTAEEAVSKHGDFWLRDMLRAAEGPTGVPGLSDLVRAIQANHLGSTQAAAQIALQASKVFRAQGNTAGVLRAELERAWALQRGSLGTHCLDTVANTLPLLVGHQYPWITAQLYLEDASCLNMVGNFGQARLAAKRALEITERANYPILYLRAIGIAASTESVLGRRRTAWDLDLRGLRIFWSNYYPALRGHQFYSDMMLTAEQLGIFYVASALAAETASLTSELADHSFEALSRAKLAEYLLREREPGPAASELTRALERIRLQPESPAARMCRLYVEIGLASLDGYRSSAQNGINRLAACATRLEEFSNELVAAEYYRIRAALLVQSGNARDTEASLQDLTKLATKSLRTLPDSRSRLSWERANSEAWRERVRLRIEMGDVRGAYVLWERFLGLPVTPTDEPVNIDGIVRERVVDNQLLLTYTRLGERIALWTLDRLGLKFRWLQISASEFTARVQHLASLCRRPESSRGELDSEGRRLFGIVLEGGVNARVIRVSADPELPSLPFDVLVRADGSFLADGTAIILSPGLFWNSSRDDSIDPRHCRAVFASTPILAGEVASELPPLYDTQEEVQVAASLFKTAILITGRDLTLDSLNRGLRDSDVFH